MADKQKVAWMYSGAESILNPDAYLTGRKVDKNFELFSSGFKSDAPNRIDVLSGKPSTSFAHAKTELDIETIRKEDPLVAIKVKEEKARQEILHNPIKMKQLQKIILKTMKKKMKDSVRNELKRRRSSSDRDRNLSTHSNRDSESRCAQRYQSGPRHSSNSSHPGYSGKKLKYESGRHCSRSSSDERDSQIRKSRDSSSSPADHKNSQVSAAIPNRDDRPQYGLLYKGNNSSRSSKSHNNYEKERLEFERLRNVPTRRPLNKADVRRRQSSPVSKVDRNKKMSAEDRDRKLKAMMDNAQWREEQRVSNIKRYAEEDKREAAAIVNSSQHSFIAPMLSEAAASGTVEGRIKRNRYNIQRSDTSMSSNFVKKS